MQEFEFQINYDEKSYTLRKYKGDERNVIVPGTFGGKPVTIIFDSVFAGHDELCSIIFPDTVTDLGEFVFDGCSNLKHIELPKSLRSLWGYTFARSAIEEITLPDGVSFIPPYAFKDCKALKKVVAFNFLCLSIRTLNKSFVPLSNCNQVPRPGMRSAS